MIKIQVKKMKKTSSMSCKMSRLLRNQQGSYLKVLSLAAVLVEAKTIIFRVLVLATAKHRLKAKNVEGTAPRKEVTKEPSSKGQIQSPNGERVNRKVRSVLIYQRSQQKWVFPRKLSIIISQNSELRSSSVLTSMRISTSAWDTLDHSSKNKRKISSKNSQMERFKENQH